MLAEQVAVAGVIVTTTEEGLAVKVPPVLLRIVTP